MELNITAVRRPWSPEKRRRESERPVQAQVGRLASVLRSYANGRSGGGEAKGARAKEQGPRSTGLVTKLFDVGPRNLAFGSWTSHL